MTKSKFENSTTLLLQDYIVVIRTLNNDVSGTPRYEITLIFVHWLNTYGSATAHTIKLKGYFKNNEAIAQRALDAWYQSTDDMGD